MNYEKIRPEDLEGEEVQIKISEKAFKAKPHCDECDLLMKEVKLDMDIPETCLTIHFEAYKCPKCGKEFLNGEQAEKLDEALMLNKIVTEKIPSYKRAANFDGHNWFVRFPTQWTKGYRGSLVTNIKPLSANDFLVHFEEKEK